MVGQILSGEGSNLLADMLKALKKEKKDVTDLTNMNVSLLADKDAIAQISNSVTLALSDEATSRLDSSTHTTPSSTLYSSDSNVMSGNFVSKYGFSGGSVVDSLKGIRARKQVETQSKSRVSTLLDDLGGIKVGDDVDRSPGSAGRLEAKMRIIKKLDTLDELEKVLKKSKKDIDKRAQEATQPKDENGQPIESLVTDTAPLEDVSSPSLDSSSSAPVIDSGVSIDTGSSAPILDSVDSVPVDISISTTLSKVAQHIDIHV